MKKCLLALLALVPVVFFSCKKEKPEDPDPAPEVIQVATKSYNVGNEDGKLEIAVEANYSFKVTVSEDAKDWLYYENTKAVAEVVLKPSTVVVGYRANTVAKERTGIVTIKGTKGEVEDITISVTQAAGDPSISLDMETVKVNPRGMTLTVPVVSNDDVVFSSDAKWVSLKDATAEGQILEFALNDSGEAREAEIVFATKTDANVKVSLIANQKAANVDPTAISILTLGNNAAADALEYLYPVLTNLGYVNIRLGNLYKGDTKLEEHAALVADTAQVYTYKYIKEGSWVTTDTTAVSLLEPEDWDFIVLQEATASAADPYASLGDVVSAIRESNPFTPLAWSIAWAPQGGDQEDAFAGIINAVEGSVKDNAEISLVIPTGTAVQNLRTSFFEDNINRAANDLSLNIGRQVAVLTWAKALTGKDVKDAIFYPYTETTADGVTTKTDTYQYESDYVPAIVEAVNNAVSEPFKVTATEKYAPYKSAIDQVAAKAALTAAGYDIADYVEVPLTLVHNAYWLSTTNAALNVAWSGSKGETLNKFIATKMLEKAQIPVGALIVVLGDYQYRPEGWQSATAKNSKTRPVNVTDNVVEVTSTWWTADGYNFRAFNIGRKDGAVLTDADFAAAAKSFGIFLPKTAVAGGLQDYLNGGFNW